MINTQGRKEIAEAVTVAALCALTTGLIGLGLEAVRNKLFREKKSTKQE
jgi:hypothetical protein